MAFYYANITAVRHIACLQASQIRLRIYISILRFVKNERLLNRVALLVEKRQRFEIDYITALSGVAFG